MFTLTDIFDTNLKHTDLADENKKLISGGLAGG